MDEATNIQKLTPSRKQVRTGDVFTLQMPDGLYSFGRVVRTDADAGGFGPAYLIYIYRVRSRISEIPDRSELGGDKLLMPPLMINKLPWTRGYFETIGHLPLEQAELAKHHSFFDVARKRYVDEMGNPVPNPGEPVADFGLGSFRTVDDDISDALGFGRAAD